MKCPVSSETIFAHLHLLQYASRPENGHLHSSPPAPVTILRRWGSIRRQSSASKACEMAVLTICKRCHSCLDSRIISHSLLMDTQVLLMPGWCASPWVPHLLLQLLLPITRVTWVSNGPCALQTWYQLRPICSNRIASTFSTFSPSSPSSSLFFPPWPGRSVTWPLCVCVDVALLMLMSCCIQAH